jgi:DNA topoisomerase-1
VRDSKRKKATAKPAHPKSLVIVESPAKARTINKYLGDAFVVKASMGHVRDLPKNRLGIDLENGFAPEYLTIRGKGDVLKELRKALKHADTVYLAPDPDREGEAIAWHLTQALKIPDEKALRITFNEITKKAVTAAIAKPDQINLDRVQAQQARRVLDRIVGYKLSPLLWEKIAKGLSAGRVQSVAVKLIVGREKEIQAFVPEEYWRVHATATVLGEEGPRAGDAFELEVKKVDGETAKLPDEAAAAAVVSRLESNPLCITSVDKRERVEKPSAPFITSTLQQAGSTRLRFSAKKTMLIAQQLYEGVEIGGEGSVGLITYMRTDSPRIAEEVVTLARDVITDRFDASYVPESPHHYGKVTGAQEAHEAIRPTDPRRFPEDIKAYLTTDQFRVYNLIFERFLASQMKPARYAVTDVKVDAGGVELSARGRVVLFEGFTRVLSHREDKEDRLPDGLAPGAVLVRVGVEPSQHFTEPPTRFSEASLVRTLEKNGIGRPSTYATILSTITDRGYVEFADRKFKATELGILVTEKLEKHFPKILDTEFTSHMESELDQIAAAETKWTAVLDEFYSMFSKSLDVAYDEMEDLKNNPEVTDQLCEKCGNPFVIKLHKRGKFLACSAYPECKNTRSMDGSARAQPIPTDHECEKCGSQLVIRTGRRGRFLACSAYPKCRNTMSCDDDGNPVLPEKTGESCDKCGADMVIRFGRRGRFIACSAYPKCRNTKAIPGERQKAPEKSGEKCPECGAEMVIKYGPRGPFQACSAYPDCKTTKPVDPRPVAEAS